MKGREKFGLKKLLKGRLVLQSIGRGVMVVMKRLGSLGPGGD
jgi:hypothetical protein